MIFKKEVYTFLANTVMEYLTSLSYCASAYIYLIA